jgi:hypothetical protein
MIGGTAAPLAGDRAFAGGLRIAPRRLRLWAIGLFLVGLAPIIAASSNGFHDWPAFWSAGRVVGTFDLVDVDRLLAWQRAHGLSQGAFPYPPASALVLWPLSLLPLDLSFWIMAALMLGAAILAGRVAAGVFGLPRELAVLSVLAWAPVTGSIVIGQNAPLALLLAVLAIRGLVAAEAGAGGRARGAGSWLAGLLYKPTLAAPLVGLLILRGRWRTLGVLAAGCLAWYLLGFLATGGDLGWPFDWLRSLGAYASADFEANADKAISIPGLAGRLGLGGWAGLAAAALVVLAIPRLRRAPMVEAAAGACLVGLAASPHAWAYDAVLLLPIIWWALAGGIAEPWRTRLVVAAYLLAPLWLVSRETVVSSVAVIVVAATAIWLAGSSRGDAGAPPDEAAQPGAVAPR